MNESPAARLQATLDLSTAEELRQLLDFAPELIAVLGPDRERLNANRWALTFLGVSLDEWRSRSLEADVHPDDLERLEAHLKRMLSTGVASALEVRVPHAGGGYRWLLARYNPDSRPARARWHAGRAGENDDRGGAALDGRSRIRAVGSRREARDAALDARIQDPRAQHRQEQVHKGE